MIIWVISIIVGYMMVLSLHRLSSSFLNSRSWYKHDYLRRWPMIEEDMTDDRDDQHWTCNLLCVPKEGRGMRRAFVDPALVWTCNPCVRKEEVPTRAFVDPALVSKRDVRVVEESSCCKTINHPQSRLTWLWLRSSALINYDPPGTSCVKLCWCYPLVFCVWCHNPWADWNGARSNILKARALSGSS